MNRDEFRQHMNNYKKARESNPSLSYWQWKANKYQDGTGGITPYSASSLVDAIYQATSNEKYLGKPTHNYDVTISEEEANRLGYYPDERGHRDDRVKKVAHPTHPSRGNWKSFNQFDLTDFGMETPNYTLFGVNDGGQDPQAVLTYKKGVVIPEITVTPKGNYYFNSYDNIKRYADGTDGIVDELKSNTRTTLTPEEQRYLLDRSRQRQRMSGSITPMFDIQDAADLTPIGDVLTAKDAYNAVQNRDYVKAGAMLGLMLAPPALGRIAKETIPSFVTAAADKINALRKRERREKEIEIG